MSASVDDVLVKIGGLGRYQIRITVLAIFLVITVGMNNYLPMFLLTIPKHRCALEGMDNDTFVIQNDYHRKLVNASIPWENEEDGISSSCEIYSKTVQGNTTMRGCTKLVYDRSVFQRSVIEQFGIVCDRKQIRTHANMAMMFGKLAVSIIQGIGSDWFGRRKALMVITLIMIISYYASAFPMNVPALLVTRFLAGFCTSGVYMTIYVLCLELYTPEYRRVFYIIVTVAHTVGGYILDLLAYFVRDYQHLCLVIAAPNILYISCYWFVDESPRWLMSRGKYDEAKKVFAKIAAFNRRPFPDDVFETIVAKSDLEESSKSSAPTQSATRVLFSLLKSKEMALTYGTIFFNWITNGIVYYALLLNVSNLAGTVYINFIIYATGDIFGNFLAYLVVEKFGRKACYVGFLLAASLVCLSGIFPIVFPSKDSPMIINGLALLGSASISTSFNLLYLFSAELFPTPMRNTVMGSFALGSKTGTVAAPYIADLRFLVGGKVGQVMPLLVCGGIAVVAFFMALYPPETSGKPLPDNVQEAVNVRRAKNASVDKDGREEDSNRMLTNHSDENTV